MPGFNDTLTMLKAVELMPTKPNFMTDMFVKDIGAVEDEHAVWDYMKGTRRMAPFVVGGVGGVELPRDGFQTREITFPYIAPERIVDDNMLKTRMFGEVLYGGMTPAERSRKIQARDLNEMKDSIDNRIGWMANRVLFNGKLEILRYVNGGREAQTTQIADYGFTNNYVPTVKWNQANADIIEDLMALNDLVTAGGGVVEHIVMGADLGAIALKNQHFLDMLDKKNVNVGEINLKYKGNGVRLLGVTPDGIQMYIHSGKYIDDDGIEKPVIPAGKLVAGGRDALKLAYGPVTLVDKDGADGQHKTYIAKMVPERIASQQSNTISNRITSRPVIVPFNVDAWAVGAML